MLSKTFYIQMNLLMAFYSETNEKTEITKNSIKRYLYTLVNDQQDSW